MKNSRNESYINRIIVGDCLEELPKLPEGCSQLIIVDPPYNLDKDFGLWKEAEHRETWLPWCRQWLAECKRVLAPNGKIYCVPANAMTALTINTGVNNAPSWMLSPYVNKF